MECLKLENDNYKRGVTDMSNGKNKDKRRKFKKVLVGLLYAMIPAYLCWIGAELISLGKDVRENSTNISELVGKIGGMETTINDINFNLHGDTGTPGILTKLNSIENRLDSVEDRLSFVEDRLNLSAVMAKNGDLLDIQTSVEPNNISTTKSSFESTTVIGTDSDGNTYIAKDLIGKTILITFVQNNKEIYFLGQYNENYHWDGYCVTNTYSLNGSLYGICESTFDDGNRLDYESFYRAETKDEWIHTKRNCTKDKDGQAVNKGTTTKYSFHYNKTKNFTITNVRVSDILYCKNFKDSKNKIMTSYYNGATSNGSYNDKSVDAYLIKYDKSGYIRTFYKGKFEDGNFQDDNALEIVFDDSNNVNKYFVYTGSFNNGNRKSDKGIQYVTQAEINKIMKENKLPDDLNWYKQ